MKNINPQFLSKLLKSPKVDIVKETTAEVQPYLGPPFACFERWRRCVIRYMRRWCLNPSSRPTGELHTPPGIREGISTSLACRFFGLYADAERIENLVLEEFMGSPRFFVTDEDVELIWCHYEGRLICTPFGDAIVWYVLEDVMGVNHSHADEVQWMLEQEECEDLKVRVKEEKKGVEKSGQNGVSETVSNIEGFGLGF
ncbi:hypothetical protein ST47_g3670 [Ascochyta rabiei]|uniref:Uncharacterized protein n=1 Tax=Didymella rabiei TaxID=5454 RepID=A0A163H5L7_DIDRA|nr:hypothetical protein ST47_g3670 [Ascochyta rabiei]